MVGHSYGGMVITDAATGNPNEKALVYIDAFIPAQGETAFGLTAARPGSCLDSASAFTAVPYPGGPNGSFRRLPQGRPDAPYPGFAQCFTNGLPASPAAQLAATQRPSPTAPAVPPRAPAWLTIPSWSLIGTADHVIPPAQQCSCPSGRTPASPRSMPAPFLNLGPWRVTRVILVTVRA